MNGRKLAYTLLTLLGLVLVGTVVVLSFVQVYFGVDERDQISLSEAEYWTRTPTLPWGSNATEGYKIEKVPRIVHQTWKTDVIPDKWVHIREECIAMNPEFEYILWTDASAREFIATHYDWFLDIYDKYPYTIQRTDAMRYFLLHHYGGVYQDLDIGCKRPMRPLLNFEIVLPRTIPVGISNDLMFAAPQHPFMDLVTHNLVTFNHQYGTHYPTVMFSTGPMFLSAQYGLWPSVDGIRGGVRVLPKSLYGKNAKPEEAEHSFFLHYYGSSWHESDAGFITFLGKFGMALMYAGAVVLLLGFLWLVWARRWTLARLGCLPPFSRLRTHKYQPVSSVSRPVTPVTDPEDNASIHSLHSVRHPRGRGRYARRQSSLLDDTASEDDTEALAPEYPSASRHHQRGLPPSYSSTWSHWTTALFHSPRPDQPASQPPSSTLFVPADFKDRTPALSRTASFASVRSASPLLPPGYEHNEVVERLLSEMEDPDLMGSPKAASSSFPSPRP